MPDPELWAEHPIPANAARRWQIGPLSLWVCGLHREWRVAWWHDEGLQESLEVSSGPIPEAWPEEVEVQRFAAADGATGVRMRPLTSDRPVVARPDASLGVPPGHRVTFFLTTPLWVEVATTAGQPLVAMPTRRLSGTWFGTSTREGQLCYASQTRARLVLDQLPIRPGRVVTEVRVHNQGPDLLPIERVHLPLPHLPLHETEAGVLWTPALTVVRHRDRAQAEVKIDRGAPAAAGRTTLRSPARQAGEPSILVRALGALLS